MGSYFSFAKHGRRADGHVAISDRFRANHPFLGEPLVAECLQVSGVVLVDSNESDDPLLQRTPKRLNLALGRPNVEILFSPPVWLVGVKTGNGGPLGVSSKERRNGVSVDVVAVSVGNPEGLVEALHALGATRYPTVGQMLLAEIGPIDPALADASLRKRTRTRRLFTLIMGMLGLVLPAGLVVMNGTLDSQIGGSTVAALVAATVAVTVGIGLLLNGRISKVLDRPAGRLIGPAVLLGFWIVVPAAMDVDRTLGHAVFASLAGVAEGSWLWPWP
ncbi:MAG: hypothetical protein GY708_29470 [Actinomycetia bacterium]|nr:hypothetical protein [Actinomycetes bacterium]MCP4959679.1 hypothetical protein [Actinomycetes bacterium]